MPDCLFSCRLKINQDSHEFILEFGTVANTKDITGSHYTHSLRLQTWANTKETALLSSQVDSGTGAPNVWQIEGLRDVKLSLSYSTNSAGQGRLG
jgi:hypothetical protein